MPQPDEVNDPGSDVFEDGVRYEDRTFRALDLRGLRFEAVELAGCRFERCRLNEATLAGCAFEECTFADSDLSVMRVPDSRFIEVSFARCKLLGVDWTQIRDSGSKLRRSVTFEACVLDLCSFGELALEGASLRRCSAHEADFSGADLSNADCREADFAGARFQNTNLSGADLTLARNYRIDPLLNKVRRARFSLPEALTLLDPFEIEIV